MFPGHKSIGAPVEITASLSDRLKSQYTSVGHREAARSETVSGWSGPLQRAQQSLKSLPRKFARTRFRRQPAVQRAPPQRPRSAGKFPVVQATAVFKRVDLVQPRFERRIVFIQQVS
jgi:hypothetical protein